ncbi:MAG: mitochondrial ribosomal small subunit component [Peltula sp. TS41687]|nr:MAG: mitochondrial ribosomal small subunit component [Peltula sp. TS41687]
MPEQVTKSSTVSGAARSSLQPYETNPEKLDPNWTRPQQTTAFTRVVTLLRLDPPRRSEEKEKRRREEKRKICIPAGRYSRDRLPISRPKAGERAIPIKTQARSATILPNFVGLNFQVHNGKNYIDVTITEDMVGHKLGEFAM